MILREEDIVKGLTGGLGLKQLQALLLGLPWPLEAGWKNKCIGKVISVEDYELFLSYRDKKVRPKTRKTKSKQMMIENILDSHGQRIAEVENQVSALFRLLSNAETGEIPLFGILMGDLGQ